MDQIENSVSIISEMFKSIEKEYEGSKTLNRKLIGELFDELKKLNNGEAAIKEFTWLFGIDESEKHFVESKECRQYFLVDFKKCWRYFDKFIKSQKWERRRDVSSINIHI